MPSEIDQAPAEQSIEERIGSLFGAEKPETPEVEADAEDTQSDQVDDSEPEESAQPEQPTIEEVEVEVEGWKGKIPAKLKAEIDKGADYTRKTQALAEEKRLYDAQIRAFQEHQAFTQAASKELTALQQIEAQLEQYRGVDLSQIDGETLNRMSMAAANLREERAKLKEALDQKQGQFKQQIVGSWDQMSNQAREVIVKSIPNWDSIAGQVAQWALNEGFPFEHITGHDRKTRERVGPGVIDPVFAKTLYKAMQWDKLQASKATAPNKIANAPPVVKPGASNPGAINEKSYKEARQKLGKSGSVDDAARLLAMRERQRPRNR
jgi:hypothetical protein